MDEQDTLGQKTGTAGDLPDGLESVSPESNVESPTEKDPEKFGNNSDALDSGEPACNAAGDNVPSTGENIFENDKLVEEESKNDDVTVGIDNTEQETGGEPSEESFGKMGDTVNNETVGAEDDVDSQVEPEQNEKEEVAMEVDQEEPKQNGPEQVNDEREDVEKPEEMSQQDDKMDVDEAPAVDEGKDVPDSGASEDRDNEMNNEFEKVNTEEDNTEGGDSSEAPPNEPQALDPFDALLRGDSSNNDDKGSKPSQVDSALNNVNNDYDSDHDAGDMDTMDNTIQDDTDVNDESLTEEANIADVTEGQGADEEVCLIPDTEREISEAEKLKALANKPETVATNNLDSTDKDGAYTPITEMKGELNTDENGEVQESFSELNSLHEDVDLGEDDAPDFADQDKDKEDGDQEAEPESVPEESLSETVIQEVTPIEQTCVQCSNTAVSCKYRLVIDSETKYICNNVCLSQFQEANPEKYTVSIKKVFIKEVVSSKNICVKCSEEKDCYYKVTSEENMFICGANCLKEYVGEEKDKYIVTKRRKFLQEINEVDGTCIVCLEEKKCCYDIHVEGGLKNVCTTTCIHTLQSNDPGIYRIKKKKVIKVKPQAPLMRLKVISNATDKYLDERHKMVAKTPEQVAAARADRDRSFLRTCAQCHAPYLGNDKNLSWETMDFCNESCLGKYQNIHGSNCSNCKNEVSITSLGKYCVRFGYDIRQFCCSGCLEEFKKGLKICSYCQRDISTGEGFLAPVGDKGQFKDFCSQFCVEKFDQMSRNPVPPPVWARCAVCSKEKLTQLEVSVDDKSSLRLCSEPCFAAFKFVNHIFPDQCRWCNKYFERKSAEAYTIYSESATHCFCCKACMNVYISNSRHIVPCNWCKVKKYNFDMIKRTLDNGQTIMMCSLNCLTLYQVSITAVSSRRIKCDQCKRSSQAQYHLTMSDATVRNFCTYQCVMSFQGQYSKTPLQVGSDPGSKQAVPTGAPRRTLNSNNRSSAKSSNMKILDARSNVGLPVIASVQSLASNTAPPPMPAPQMNSSLAKSRSKRGKLPEKPPPAPVEPPKPPTPPPPPPPKIYNHVVIKPPPPKVVKNIGTLTKPIMVSKGLTCKPNMVSKELQTDAHLERRILIPVPVPIYVPSPMPMFSMPFPVPVPIPLPIPVPVFVPTTRNTANGIMKEIKKIHEKMPTDPFEAELLMMAEMVAGEKKKAESDSDSEDDAPVADDNFSPDAMDTNNAGFGEEVLQMALKMATEYEEPAVDLESAMTASTITPSSHPIGGLDDAALHHHQMMLLEQQRAAAAAAGGMARKRGRAPNTPSPAPQATPQSRAKRSRRSEPAAPPPPPQPEPVREPVEKPDANMCLKYTFGVNAWKQWVVTKNQEIEKSSIRRKPFKSDILQLTADELNYSLCLFVKEVRKPNGSEYAPDTIYYLVLGIQQYLFENGRIDNIFTDSYYEKFTDCLDEVARKFSVLYNDSQYIVTRVEEEHLWECKQLGAHSPHVLLSTLMFFNTKHFNLVTPEEHMQLSFSHIMKHWKRNPNQPGAAKMPGSRNVLLRFYPPQSALEANSRKKKVYEQQENEENPLRCPVKLYEFYLSKCPESVKTRNDVFYLMPERSCVPDSPVWYSTQALGKEQLSKMLHRVKMVKEINIALLTS